jgi:hypothetical protein
MSVIPLTEEELRFIKSVAIANPNSRSVIEEIHDLHRCVLSLVAIGRDGNDRNTTERVGCDIRSAHVILNQGHGYELVVRLFVPEILGRRIEYLVWREKARRWVLMAEGNHRVETTSLEVRFS